MRGHRGAPGAAAYNPAMLHTLRQPLQSLQALAAPAVLERLTLVANHLLASESVATQRLLPHAGKSVALLWQGLPALLPPPPTMAWTITRAGLLELREGDAAADLTLTVDASQPLALLAQALANTAPTAEIAGDAALAADVGWLMQNLRWDAAADLERLFPPMVAQGLADAGQALLAMVRAALERWPRMRPS